MRPHESHWRIYVKSEWFWPPIVLILLSVWVEIAFSYGSLFGAAIGYLVFQGAMLVALTVRKKARGKRMFDF